MSLSEDKKPKQNTNKEPEKQNEKNENKIEFSKIIGSYALFDQIGKGSFSKVTKAIHLITEQVVAVKILEKEKIEDEIDIERITREIEILKTIMHPNIAQMYESFSTIHNIYLMIEYAEGGDLFDYITNKDHLSEIESCYFYRQLIGVLEYLIEMGISHRDIKPENILLDKSKKNIKVIDFGLSNYCKNNELLESSCGSPCYASPEMLSGNPYKGVTTDLWSSGIVLYCMLVGSLPFDNQELKVLYSQIKKGEFYVPSFLSMNAIDLLKKILEVNPAKRINIKQLKKHPWFNITENIIYKGINYEYGKFPCDKSVVDYVIKNYFDDEDIKNDDISKMIKNHQSNKYTATYFLVKKYILHKDDMNDMIMDEKKKKCDLTISNKKIVPDNSLENSNSHKNKNIRNKSMNTKCKTENNIDFPINEVYTNNNKFSINTKIILLSDKINKSGKNSNNALTKKKEIVFCKNNFINEKNSNRINKSNVQKNILKLELKDNSNTLDKSNNDVSKRNNALLKPKCISTEPYSNKLNNITRNKSGVRNKLLDLEKNKKNILYLNNKNITNFLTSNEMNIFKTKIKNSNKNKYISFVPKIDLSSANNTNPNKINIQVINFKNKNNSSINNNMKNNPKENTLKKNICSPDYINNIFHDRNFSTSTSKNQNIKYRTTDNITAGLAIKTNNNNLNCINNYNYKKLIEKNCINKNMSKFLQKSIDNNHNLIINPNYQAKKQWKIKKNIIDLLTSRESKKEKWILNPRVKNNESNSKTERNNNNLNLGFYNNFNIINNLVLNHSSTNNYFYNKGNVINNNINYNNAANVKHFYTEKYSKGNFKNKKK